MKKHIQFLLVLVLTVIVSQLRAQNIFPNIGNVGIGTLTPSSALEIKEGTLKINNLGFLGNSDATLKAIGVNENGEIVNTVDSTYRFILPPNSSFDFSYSIQLNDSNLKAFPLYFSSDGRIIFPTQQNPIPQATVNVGNTIFNGTARFPLGSLFLDGAPTPVGGGFRILGIDADGKVTVMEGIGPGTGGTPGMTTWNLKGNSIYAGEYLGTNNNQALIFKANSNEYMSIGASGSVNLGLSNHIQEMNIYSSNNGLSIANYNETNTDSYGLKVAIQQPEQRVIMAKLQGEEIFNVLGNGNGFLKGKFGINTLTPSAALEIAHDTYNGGIVLNRTSTSSLNSSISFRQNGSEKWAIGSDVANTNSNTFSIKGGTDNGTKLFIDANGKVGIGTTTIGTETKLAVEGKISAREIKVLVGPFPDYVFEKGYSLMSLHELNKYIEINKHLPGIPSAKEVEQENGIDLGSLNCKLLEKIEELTLHLINQQKELDALKMEIKTLKVND